jgi:hypothetical protein
MSLKHGVCLCFVSLALAGCATTAELGNQVVDYTKQVGSWIGEGGSWIGQKVESLYAKEGTPSSTETQSDGGKIVEYKSNQTLEKTPDGKEKVIASQPNQVPTAPTVATGGPQAAVAAPETKPANPNIRVVPCTTRYRTDATGTIKSWTIDGEGCKAVEEAPPPPPHP